MTYTANGTSFTMLTFATMGWSAGNADFVAGSKHSYVPPATSSLDQQHKSSSVDHARPINANTTPEIVAPFAGDILGAKLRCHEKTNH
jgi:hypothetical protein